MIPYVIETNPNLVVNIETDVVFNTEIVSLENITIFGNVSFQENYSFTTKYFVNDILVAYRDTATKHELVATSILNTDLVLGENTIKIIFYNILNEELASITKTVFRSYYDYFVMEGTNLLPKTSLSYEMSVDSTIYLGSSQVLKKDVLSDLSIKLIAENDGNIRIRPILDSWSVRTHFIPAKLETIYYDTSVVAGENVISLVPLLISCKTLYGLIITGDNGLKLQLLFEKAEETYYKIFIQRPQIVLHDDITIKWPNIKFDREDYFEKFVLLRDGVPVFETTDFNVREYTDKDLTLGATYLYQLQLYVIIPPEVVWEFVESAKDLWQTTEVDGEIHFYSDNFGFKEYPINVKCDLSKSSLSAGLSFSDSTGINIVNASGTNIFKEFEASASFDFKNRVAITKLLLNTNMDTSLVSYIEEATYVRDFTEGKLYKLKLKKRIRDIDFD